MAERERVSITYGVYPTMTVFVYPEGDPQASETGNNIGTVKQDEGGVTVEWARGSKSTFPWSAIHRIDREPVEPLSAVPTGEQSDG